MHMICIYTYTIYVFVSPVYLILPSIGTSRWEALVHRACEMKTFGAKLLKHHTTRKLVKVISPELDQVQRDDQLDHELREGLQWQQCLVDALLTYSDAVSAAFESLAQAQEALMEGGIDMVEDAAPLAGALARSAREARSFVHNVVSQKRGPLEMFKAGLMQAAVDVQKADRSATEFQRYNEKVEGLADTDFEQREHGEVSKKAQARLTRNKDKLDGAAMAASVAHLRAVDALHGCSQRHGALCDIAVQIVTAGSSALRAVGREASRAMEATSEYPAACNPFQEDVNTDGGMHRHVHADGTNLQLSPSSMQTVPLAAVGAGTVAFSDDVRRSPLLAAATPLPEGYNPFAESAEASSDTVRSPLPATATPSPERCNPFAQCAEEAGMPSDGGNPFEDDSEA